MIRLLPRLTLPTPGDEMVLGALSRPRIPSLHIDRFPSGIDGRHIDVALGPALDKAVRMFVSALLQERLAAVWGQPVTATSEKLSELFREQVQAHHQTAVRLARDNAALEQIQLFQLALVKLVFTHVDEELARVRAALEDERFMSERQSSGKGLQLHRQAALLGRNAAHLRYRTVRLALREIQRLEHGVMRNLRKSVLGRSWPLAEPMLYNPLLMLDGIGTLRDFVEHYPAVLHDLPRARRLGDALVQTLADWLPDGITGGEPLPGDLSPAGDGGRADTGFSGLASLDRWARALIGPSERRDAVRTWLDEPDNVAALLGGVDPDWPAAGPWAPKDLSNLQRRLNAQFGRALARSGLHRQVQAAYALAAIYPALGVRDVEGPVFDYLSGDVDRQGFTKRIEAAKQGMDSTRLLRRLEERLKAYRRRTTDHRQPQLARLAADLGRLRRDLKLAAPMRTALGQIRLLDDPEALAHSRENNCLQVFCKETLLPDTRGSLVGHAMARIDLRGTNELVATMMRRELNPAAYFSRFLYDPLTALLERFEGQKVMVEAGTLVLATLQHSGEGSAQLAVARACALVQGLMEQVDALNRESDRLGLRSLECSMAVVFADQPPTYLYDRSRRVLVSSANTRARRMSSCHALLRSSCTLPSGQRLCVVSPLDGDDQARGDDLVRYNVNGIELDAAAFVRLHAEVAMRKVRLRDSRSGQSMVVYAGQCPDAEGKLHWLIVREGPVKLWMGRRLLESPDEGRAFYELVLDARIVKQVRQRLEAREPASRSTAKDMRH